MLVRCRFTKVAFVTATLMVCFAATACSGSEFTTSETTSDETTASQATTSSEATSSETTTAKGTLQTETFDSEALNQKMEFAIYLPPGYNDPQNASVRYPVTYLLPSSAGGVRNWAGADLTEQMDELLAKGQVQPMIVVVPQERPGNQTVKGTGYVDAAWGNWETYTTKDVVDEIDSNYRTIDSREGRVIVGNSEGGYGAVNLGLKHLSEYGVIGSLSGYFTIDEKDLSHIFGGNQELANANSPMLYLPQLKGEQLPPIYLLVGQDDKNYLEQNQKFAEELKVKGAPYELHIVAADHRTKEYLPDFLVFASKHLTMEG